jgi:hypothetical protein
MKKLLTLFTLLLLTSCMKDEIMEPIFLSEVPETLEISDIQGIKLENTIVSSEVRMNIKLPSDGKYRVKIRDIASKLVSQEELTAKEGDNILAVYTSSLDKSSYTLELVDSNNNVLGRAVFVNQ